MSEHDFEPIRGLPGPLPDGETLLWQGRPSAWRLACDAFHIRLVAAYFATMMGWSAAAALTAGGRLAPVLATEAAALPIALSGLALLAGLALLNSRTTVYTITNKRVVLRFGAAFTKAINIPFTVIEGASLKQHGDGSGDLALSLDASNKIAVLQLWPHARPWRLSRPEPALRSLADVRSAGEVLTAAMADRIVIAPPAVAASPTPAMGGGRLAGATA
jgi:hypothetical protein